MMGKVTAKHSSSEPTQAYKVTAAVVSLQVLPQAMLRCGKDPRPSESCREHRICHDTQATFLNRVSLADEDVSPSGLRCP